MAAIIDVLHHVFFVATCKASKVKVCPEPIWLIRKVFIPSYLGINHLKAFVFPPEEDASPSQFTPSSRRYPFVLLGEEKQFYKVSAQGHECCD